MSEKVFYKVGDQVEILRDKNYNQAPNGCYKKGAIHTVAGVDREGDPWFEGDTTGFGWANSGNWFRKVEKMSEEEKRGAKFGTMGVIKSTGKKCVFLGGNGGKVEFWDVMIKGKFVPHSFFPKEIRLDHEPEYKEIPFSEATHEQRMNVVNLIFEYANQKGTVKEIMMFENGMYVYQVNDSEDWPSHITKHLKVKVPA